MTKDQKTKQSTTGGFDAIPFHCHCCQAQAFAGMKPAAVSCPKRPDGRHHWVQG